MCSLIDGIICQVETLTNYFTKSHDVHLHNSTYNTARCSLCTRRMQQVQMVFNGTLIFDDII